MSDDRPIIPAHGTPDHTAAQQAPLVTLWVIYLNVTDRPGPYTVRPQTVSPAYGLMVGPARDFLTLEDARAGLPPGLYNLGRKPDDDSAIVEVWI